MRIVASADLLPSPGVNLLVGGNASGKTSVLEALHLLATGRSFVTANPEKVVRHGETELRVVARTRNGPRESVLGLARRIGQPPEIHVDGEKVPVLTRLAERLPMLAVYPGSDTLITGGPAYRRRFLDWGVFHVEQGFMPAWRRYRRTLEQRNAALRGAVPPAEISVWDTPLAEAGEQLAAFRARYVEALRPFLTAALDTLLPGVDIDLALSHGWPADESLADALRRGRESDRRHQRTGSGPHRAELRIRSGGHDVRATLSRGQQKLLVYGLKMAQADQLRDLDGRLAVLLLDDLASELDGASRGRVLTLLGRLGSQAFVTAIDPAQFADLASGPAQKVFHVEQGRLAELV